MMILALIYVYILYITLKRDHLQIKINRCLFIFYRMTMFGEICIFLLMAMSCVSTLPINEMYKLRNVSSCPNAGVAWDDDIKTFNCGGNKRYHCIFGQDGTLYKLCMERKYIKKGKLNFHGIWD